MIRREPDDDIGALAGDPLSMISPNRSGTATTRAESRITSARNTPIWDL
jgi:hypothetical protein